MPKDYKSFCLVAAHLVKNAHRYYSNEDVSKVDIKEDNETAEEMQPTPEPEDMCRAVNHKLNKIRSLKRQN